MQKFLFLFATTANGFISAFFAYAIADWAKESCRFVGHVLAAFLH